MIRVFQCEDSLTGILAGVYDAWDSRLGHANVRLTAAENEDLELFCEYVEVEPDVAKAAKVFKTIEERLGEEALEAVARAAASAHCGKADAIYRTIVLGLHLPEGKEIMGMLGQPDVRLVFELSRKVWHIAHRYMGFVRFRELESGVLFSEIQAEADILSQIAPHFADRLFGEHWVIYDRAYQKAAVHPKGRGWFLLEKVDGQGFEVLKEAADEARYGSLWRTFHQAVGIETRVAPKLQQSFLPLKFRQFMNEFGEKGRQLPEGGMDDVADTEWKGHRSDDWNR